jgi:hypothetical protein
VPTSPAVDESKPTLRVHLVSHTHWDREWYEPASVFRQRLIPLIDALLECPDRVDSGDGAFLLDGQCILLMDYLAIRPEREALLRTRLAEGRIEVGPWYVLADNLIPSGEAILRNLEAGARIARRFGATSPAVAYCPDVFGHPAMLPAIAHGYGFPAAVVWRGLGGASHPVSDAMWWRAPDGSRVLAYHLPPDGYEFGSALPEGDDEASARWARMAAFWRSRNTTQVVLLPNGADHHARQRHRPESVRAIARAAARDDATVLDSTLNGFARAVSQAAADTALPTVAGELRDSYGYTWTLQGTFGTRAAQKRMNAVLERGLLRDVEPWLALAWLHGPPDAFSVSCDARLTLAQLPPLLEHAWEALLRTHPHDTLCGCSIDAVAHAMDARQRDVAAQTVGLRDAALLLALGHDPAVARDQPVLDRPPVLVRNRVARARGGLCELTLVQTLGDVPVGPGSAGPTTSRGSAAPPVSPATDVAVSFGTLLLQSGVSIEAFARRESPQHYPDNDRVRRHRTLAWVPAVPALGVAVLRPTGEPADGPRYPVSLRESGGVFTVDNGLVQLRVGPGGVTVIVGDRILPNVLTVQSTIDLGDSYTASLRGAPRVFVLDRVAEGAGGPLRASVRLRWRLVDAASPDGAGGGSIRGRARTVVETELSLDADSPVLRCQVRGINRARDHRVQIVWQTDVVAGVVHADAAFGPVRRDPILANDAAQRVEQVPPTMPLHRWINVSDTVQGATLIADGLAEAEAHNGCIALTLLRAIGALSRADLPERPGHAGWPAATPAAQSLGRFRARFGLLLHDAWSAATLLRIEDAADDFLLPLAGATLRDYEGMVSEMQGVALEGDGLRVSAVTLSRDGSALLLRATNVTDTEAEGTWVMPHEGLWEVTPCRLDETPTGPARATSERIALHLGPRALATVCVRRAPAAYHQ